MKIAPDDFGMEVNPGMDSFRKFGMDRWGKDSFRRFGMDSGGKFWCKDRVR